MISFCVVFVPFMGVVYSGYGFNPEAGDGERIQRLQVEIAGFQQELVHDNLEIEAWNIKLEKLKDSILELKIEKEFVQSQVLPRCKRGIRDPKLGYFVGRPGPQGKPGPPGIPGKPGEIGEKGIPGIRGKQGLRGPIGPYGPPGWRGPPGFIGSEGIKGVKGEEGFKGIQGVPGDYGYVGFSGPNGQRGPQGPEGDFGFVGMPGPPGPKGDKGFTGAPGEVGPSGSVGMPGQVGVYGAHGLAGEVGNQGPIGKIGAKGQKGGRGLEGDIGPPGEVGLPGPVYNPYMSMHPAPLTKVQGFPPGFDCSEDTDGCMNGRPTDMGIAVPPLNSKMLIAAPVQISDQGVQSPPNGPIVYGPPVMNKASVIHAPPPEGMQTGKYAPPQFIGKATLIHAPPPEGMPMGKYAPAAVYNGENPEDLDFNSALEDFDEDKDILSLKEYNLLNETSFNATEGGSESDSTESSDSDSQSLVHDESSEKNDLETAAEIENEGKPTKVDIDEDMESDSENSSESESQLSVDNEFDEKNDTENMTEMSADEDSLEQENIIDDKNMDQEGAGVDKDTNPAMTNEEDENGEENGKATTDDVQNVEQKDEIDTADDTA